MNIVDTLILIFAFSILIGSILNVVSYWVVFEKANQPGWAAIVPIYNVYIMTKIANITPWIFLGLLIPYVNILIFPLINYKIAEAFGKDTGFCIVSIFFSLITMPILAFSNAQFVGAKEMNFNMNSNNNNQ